MIEIDEKKLRKWQFLQLKILLEFDRICKKNGIKYNLCGGTLIGCVRHKGFIPWDDDIDVAMLRSEYEKFIEACKADLNPDFFLQCPQTDKQFPFGVKLMLKGTEFVASSRNENLENKGILIDVLAYDNIPDNRISRFFYCNWFHVILRIYFRRYGFHPHPHKLYQRLAFNFFDLLFKFYSTEKLGMKLNNYCKKYANKKTKEVTILGGVWGYKKEKHLYETVTNLTTGIFEGYELSIPVNYDLLLTEQYGDYMKLPPEEKRVIRHTCSVLDFGKYEEEAEKFYQRESWVKK